MGEIGVPPALTDAVESLKDAISAGRTDIFRKLLEACETCDGGGIAEKNQLINSLSTQDGTFLHMATKLGRSDIVRALLAAGADPGVLDRDGNTPLQVSPSPAILTIFMEDLLRATAKSEIGRVCQLIASGMNVNAYDNQLSKNTPLHWAASFADVDTINCLAARGADVNITNSDGATPLHDAVARGSADIVEALLAQGASPHIRCRKGRCKGQSAFQMAQINPNLVSIMKKYANNKSYRNGMQNGIHNGSVSPVLARRSLPDTGSVDSLPSLGTDSVIIQDNPVQESTHRSSSQSPIPGHKLVRAHSLTSVGEESVISNLRTNALMNGRAGNARVTRTPLESTSSLELTPNMEQVCERLASVHMSTPPRPLVTNSALHHLWPQPKRIIEISGPPWKLPNLVTLAIAAGPIVAHQIVDVWNIHKPWLNEAGCDIQLGRIIGSRHCNDSKATVTCAVDSALTLSEAHYTVTVEEGGVHVLCGSLASLHHALITFTQLLRVFRVQETDSGQSNCSLSIPPVVIIDFPSVPNRGFLLDVAPMARIPKLDRLCQIIDSLVSLKINQLHLIFKISFNCKSTSVQNDYLEPQKDSDCSCQLPYSPSELVSLERYCNDRGLTLVPGFEFDIENSSRQTLAPRDVAQVISDALIHLPSARYVHIGPFLTSFLADCNSNAWAHFCIPSSAALMVCANVFHSNAAALRKLPLTTVLVEYGFQADYDFSKGCKMAIEKGRTLAVCSGTAAWTSLSGWPEAGVSNVYSGVVSSLESGANCLLVAQWSNTTCLTPLLFAWPPLLVAAGLSWNHNTHWDFVQSSVGSLFDQHVVKVPNCGLGDAIIEMGRCETWLTRVSREQSATDPRDLPSCNGSTLYQLFADPDSVVVDHLGPEVFSSVMRHVRKAVKESPHRNKTQSTVGLSQVATISKWPLATQAVLELHLAVDMILTACRLGRSIVTVGTNPRSNMGMAVVNPGVANLPPTIRTDLANKILALREVYSSVWLQCYQPNGLHCSLLVFSTLLSRLIPEQTVHGV